MVCPKCGEIFNQEGYKVTVQAFAAQEFAQAREEGKEVPTREKIEDNEPTMDIILD